MLSLYMMGKLFHSVVATQENALTPKWFVLFLWFLLLTVSLVNTVIVVLF